MAVARPVGRPPRIDRQSIADAVLEIGLGRASMKAVAEHLGVSVGGLYHHVRNRKELLMLAAERSMATVELPEDRGQHWSEWLREWARYSRAALVDEPEVFEQFLAGAVSFERVVEVADSVIEVLTRQGFTALEALASWEAVGRLAVGAAAEAVRMAAATEAGRPQAAEWHRVLASRPPDTLLAVRSIVGDTTWELERAFEDELSTLLVGMAVRRGEPWAAIVGAGEAGTPRVADQDHTGVQARPNHR